MADGMSAFSVFGDVSLRGGDQVLGMMSGIGGKVAEMFTSPTGLALAAAAAVVGVGVAAFNAASEIGHAEHDIRTATGATGKDLEGLKKTMEYVSTSTATSFKDSASIVSSYVSRLGLKAGPELSSLSLLTAKFALVTKQSAGDAADSIAKMANNWNLSVKQIPGLMDYLITVSERTGVAEADLMQAVTKGGPYFRALGMDVRSSAAFLGDFGKAGIDTGRLTMGLNKTLMAFATDLHQGFLIKPPKGGTLDALDTQMNQIAKVGSVNAKQGFQMVLEAIKHATTAADAHSIALKFLGRSGIAMSDAIRSGKVNVDDMTGAFTKNQDSVNAAWKAQETLGQKFTTFVNLIKTKLAPIGDFMIKIAKGFMDIVNAALSGGKGVSGFGSVIAKVLPVVMGLLLPIVGVIQLIARNWGLIAKAFSDMWAVVSPILANLWKMIVSAVQPAIQNLKDAWAKLQPILKPLIPVLEFIGKVLLGTIVVVIGVVVVAVVGLIVIFAKVVQAVTWVIKEFVAFGVFTQQLGTNISKWFATAINNVIGFFKKLPGEVMAALQSLVRMIQGPINTVADFLSKLNPFARHSPSLVDNVLAGTKQIAKAYSGLGGMKIAAPQMGSINASGVAGLGQSGGALGSGGDLYLTIELDLGGQVAKTTQKVTSADVRSGKILTRLRTA